jgi:hypothetical protein
MGSQFCLSSMDTHRGVEMALMLKRLWLVLSIPWAVLFLWSGSTRAGGIQDLDIGLALGPFLMGPLMLAVGRFVVTGRWRSRGRLRLGFGPRQYP